ncbi:AraC family transcriptional regulator [Clostridium sporogenes]|uniref:helix-turn-helix domain-containing protein n=1 Tax=Clostridium sporogenes TaxID=1509 RepID=UPI0005EF137B|nr:AraC family transcriptional regulator [Clostridium sporogenes]MCW6092540.1 AraC family transcriptional regulator [Clostridium sporogenes]NFG95257.1 helix-turn-helix transcriptional regulator [Clostridium sporogenes]NFH32940.1 helix-turn-helix transcriptional regulator [Clostridium sporogenes]NFL19702.1 helix-turn-helix transcriptional regulator [Clostridium sporogenes]NFL77505.1 helix-turn-helix transcriptional regulator [Clostridium sporogenes]
MDKLLEGKVSFGNNITVIKRGEDCTVYKMKDITGEGTMTCYNVFQGIDLIYNDFHLKNCFSEFIPKVKMMAIDHCRKGRIEWEFQTGSYVYLQEGDLQINGRNHQTIGFGFPLSHYNGITVAIYIDEALKTLSTIFGGFSIDLQGLYNKFCYEESPFIMRAKDSIQHIFSELYNVPNEIRTNYFKVKILELLLFLSVLDVRINGEERPYFTKKQVETVKNIMKYMTEHIDKNFTLEDLSSKFEIPLTSMKNYFKGVYGTSIYSYIRSYRMQVAASMLRETNESITVIAGKVGYENSSKFASAFKKVMNSSPSEYRRKFV